MFQNLALAFENANQRRDSIFLVHPVQLSRWLDEAWAAAQLLPPLPGVSSTSAPLLGDSAIVDTLDLPRQTPPNPPFVVPSGIDPTNPDTWRESLGPQQITQGSPGLLWHHLIYAYLVESTGVTEIFTAVMRHLVTSEKLGPLSPAGTKWLRATEELFYREPPLFSIAGVSSELRPYSRVNRRNAYWRMFGFDLPHGVPQGSPGSDGSEVWKANTEGGVNSDFRSKWTELLRQVWLGRENRQNQVGANAADPSYIALLCTSIRDMMINRRRGGRLAREEFAYVSTLSWFDLTIRLTNTPIIEDLKCQASSEDGRLANLAAKVGMKSAVRTRELLLLSEKASAVLRSIELGLFDTPAQAQALYANTPLGNEMNEIINLWQSATGDRIKEAAITTAKATSQPLRIPTPAATGGNGAAT